MGLFLQLLCCLCLLLGGQRLVIVLTGCVAPDLLLASRHRRAIDKRREGDWLAQSAIRQRNDPARLARPVEPNPVGVDLGMRSNGEHGPVGICGNQAVPPRVRTAVAPGLTDATLVIGEDRDSVLDERGDDRAVVEPWLLTAPVYPDNRGVAS